MHAHPADVRALLLAGVRAPTGVRALPTWMRAPRSSVVYHDFVTVT
jgi:hypothetical protein